MRKLLVKPYMHIAIIYDPQIVEDESDVAAGK